MNTQQLKTKISDYKQQLKEVKQLAETLKSQIEIERKNIPTSAGELEKRLRQAEAELEKVQGKINDQKSEARNLKDQITKLKDDFELTPEDDRLINWNNLSPEIQKLGAGIDKAESAIAALEMQKFSAEQAIDAAEIKLEAYRQGMHEKPLEEDFRMKAALQEKRRIERYIEKRERELEELQ